MCKNITSADTYGSKSIIISKTTKTRYNEDIKKVTKSFNRIKVDAYKKLIKSPLLQTTRRGGNAKRNNQWQERVANRTIRSTACPKYR